MPVLSVPAYNGLQSYRQPDGTIIKYKLRGDERLHWIESEDGYLLARADNGFMTYATVNNNRISASNVRYVSGKVEKEAVPYKVKASDVIPQLAAKAQSSFLIDNCFPLTGKRKLLMLLVNFNDTRTTYEAERFEALMNEENYQNTGSFRDFFLENSYGKLDIETTVVGWIKLSRNKSMYSTEDMTALITEALAEASKKVDIAQFDNDGDGVLDGLSIIHQGTGQEVTGSSSDIWSHSGEVFNVYVGDIQVSRYTIQPELLLEQPIAKMTTVGVLCHEFGHNLGAPDYYDVDYETSGNFEGTGVWDLMAGGIWNEQSAPGDSPSHINMWQKFQFGWAEPEYLTESCTVTDMPVASESPTGYILNTLVDGDYYVIEHRKKIKFDRKLPGEGMIVYHIDENRISSTIDMNMVNADCYQGIYTVCAGATTNPSSTTESFGDINSDKTPFPGSTGKKEFSDITMPSMNSNDGKYSYRAIKNIDYSNGALSFDFVISDVPDPVKDFKVYATEGIVNLSWEQPSEGNVSKYRIFRNDILVAQNEECSFTDTELKENIAEYKIDVLYDNGLYSPFSKQSIRVPAQRVNSASCSIKNNSAIINWQMESNLTRIDNSIENAEIQYLSTQDTFDVAQRFNASELKTYIGHEIQKISFFPFTSQRTTKYKIRVWKSPEGEENFTVASERDATEYASGQIHEMMLKEPVMIEEGYDYLIGLHFDSSDRIIPVICDKTNFDKGLGNLLKTGDTWDDSFLTHNFFIYATISEKEKQNSFTENEEPAYNENYDWMRDTSYPIGFNVYRDGEYLGFTSQRIFMHNIEDNGKHTYNIACLYEGGNESAYFKFTADYAVCGNDIAVQEETFKVTVSNGIVNITSPEQARFAIVDINGTTIIKGNINKGENAIDMNHSTGVFIITIESCNKVSTHKIII